MLPGKFKSSINRAAVFIQELVPVSLFSYFTGPFVPVFMMHRFACPERDINGVDLVLLRECLEYFRKSGYEAISLETLASALINGDSVPDKTAVFTIDDGFFDQFELAGPLFAEYDIPLTYFLITDFIDKKLWPWDDQISYILNSTNEGKYLLDLGRKEFEIVVGSAENRRPQYVKIRNILKSTSNSNLYDELPAIYRLFDVDIPAEIPDKYRPMEWEDAQTLIKQGHNIAAHTCSHRILSRLQRPEAESEIMNSIRRVGEMIESPSPVFAYPTGRSGDFTHEDVDFMSGTGLLATVTTVPGSVLTRKNSKAYLHSLPRYSMPDDLIQFRQCLSWLEVIKERIKA